MMESAVTPAVVPSVGVGVRGNFRGRGNGGGMRGGFDRGRGRPMLGRGPFMGAMGRGGVMGMGGPPPPQGMMMGGRGMRLRGAPMFPMRAGFVPRNGPHMRGARHPSYSQPPKQHTGAENNKTVSPASNTISQSSTVENPPIPPTTIGTAQTPPVNKVPSVADATHQSSQVDTLKQSNMAKPPVANGALGGVQGYTRGGRGRGSHYVRGGSGRGAFNHNPNMGGYNNNFVSSSNPDQNQMGVRRTGPPRGRGGYNQNIQRPTMNQQQLVNNQSAPMIPIKRGAPGGPGSKRGRYEGAPYAQRNIAPNYHHAQQQHVPGPMPASHGGYTIPQTHQPPPPPPPPQSGYNAHDSSHVVDPYAQSYSAPSAQTAYNGYAQSTYPTTAQGAIAPVNASYTAQASTEYDQSQYQNYNYGSQQDTRYPNYGQDYTQQYGVSGVDYNQAQQTDYSQHQPAQSTGVYDDRNFSGYDASYQQGYSNQTGYY